VVTNLLEEPTASIFSSALKMDTAQHHNPEDQILNIDILKKETKRT
jgi:hypothetical protein